MLQFFFSAAAHKVVAVVICVLKCVCGVLPTPTSLPHAHVSVGVVWHGVVSVSVRWVCSCQ